MVYFSLSPLSFNRVKTKGETPITQKIQKTQDEGKLSPKPNVIKSALFHTHSCLLIT